MFVIFFTAIMIVSVLLVSHCFYGGGIQSEPLKITSSIGVCTRVRDEQHILTEWLEHYLVNLRFSRAIIYDDYSNPPVLNTIGKFTNDPRVVVVSSPTKNQAEAYTDGLSRCIDLDWVLLCDADEFVWTDGRDIREHMATTFPPEVGTVLVNWLVFGTSGLLKLDKRRPIREQFVKREELNCYWNQFVKSFVRPTCPDLRVWVHITSSNQRQMATAGGEIVSQKVKDETGNTGPCIEGERVVGLDHQTSPVLMVHYMTLDFESMAKKSIRNKALADIGMKYTKHWYEHTMKDSVVDRRMHKYLRNKKN